MYLKYILILLRFTIVTILSLSLIATPSFFIRHSVQQRHVKWIYIKAQDTSISQGGLFQGTALISSPQYCDVQQRNMGYSVLYT